MFGLQPWHLFAILVVALLVFGPQRLPEIGRVIGQSIREFREAVEGSQREIREAVEEKPIPSPEAPSVLTSRTTKADVVITKSDGEAQAEALVKTEDKSNV
jgi:sec-independent protein translocase protein TatA